MVRNDQAGVVYVHDGDTVTLAAAIRKGRATLALIVTSEPTPVTSASVAALAERLYRGAAATAVQELVARRGGRATTSGCDGWSCDVTVERRHLRSLVDDLLAAGYGLAPATAPFWQLRGAVRLEGALQIAITTTSSGLFQAGLRASLRAVRPALETRPGRALAREAWRWTTGRHHHRTVRGVRFRSYGAFAPFNMTAVLVEEGLEIVRGVDSPCIVDVGTATGAAATLFALERPDARVIATDVSVRSLRAARRNAEVAGAHIELRRGSVLQPFHGEKIEADLIVSNLPFVPPSQIRTMSPWALLGSIVGPGPDGLDLVRSLIDQSSEILRVSGRLLIEVLPDQVQAVQTHASMRGFIVERVVALDDHSDCVVQLRRTA